MSSTLTARESGEAGTTGRSGRSAGRWPLTGALAGVLGVAATLATDVHVMGPDGAGDVSTTIDVVSRISQGKAHLSVIFGYAAVVALLVLAAQWRRLVEPRVLTSTAARVVSGGLTSAAGALALGYGWKGALSVYLPGGSDAGRGFDQIGLYVYYVLNDFGAYIGWLGVVVAAGAVAWMAFRERTVSRWIGTVSLLPVLSVTGMTVAFGLPGFPGLVGPVWLVIAFTGMAFGRSTVAR